MCLILTFFGRVIVLLLLFSMALAGIFKLADIYLKENLKDNMKQKYRKTTTILIITVTLLYAAIAALMASIL